MIYYLLGVCLIFMISFSCGKTKDSKEKSANTGREYESSNQDNEQDIGSNEKIKSSRSFDILSADEIKFIGDRDSKIIFPDELPVGLLPILHHVVSGTRHTPIIVNFIPKSGSIERISLTNKAFESYNQVGISGTEKSFYLSSNDTSYLSKLDSSQGEKSLIEIDHSEFPDCLAYDSKRQRFFMITDRTNLVFGVKGENLNVLGENSDKIYGCTYDEISDTIMGMFSYYEGLSVTLISPETGEKISDIHPNPKIKVWDGQPVEGEEWFDYGLIQLRNEYEKLYAILQYRPAGSIHGQPYSMRVFEINKKDATSRQMN